MNVWYERINWRMGEWASQEAQAKVKTFWMSTGKQGVEYLAARLAKEQHMDLQEGVANLLADFGAMSVDAILKHLDQELREDRLESFLKALCWMGEQAEHERIEPVVARYLDHDDACVRERACWAAEALPRERKVELLERRRKVETDSDVIEAIGDALAE